MARLGHDAAPGDDVSVSLRTMADCEQLFDQLAAPPENTLKGVFRGRLAAVTALDSLPGRLRRAIAYITPHLRFPWYGKAFDGDNGANVWLTSTGRFQRFGYRVQYGEQAARLSYQRPDNPRFLRGLEAEIRSMAPDRYLCHAALRGTVVLYFTLEQ
ncbi:hypothetical protein NM962_17250 [Mycobacterium sp. SVM_VP21]|nr:hypothetical protein NM962_17250 [Mycobacterium sp. SVM_VP21]